MLTKAIEPTSHTHCWVPSERSPMPSLTTPYAPSFMSTPACSIDTAVGAEACPSGDHVWSGQMPARIPKPTSKNRKTHDCRDGSKSVASISRKEKDVEPPATYRARMPTRMKADPKSRYRVSFIAAYS